MIPKADRNMQISPEQLANRLPIASDSSLADTAVDLSDHIAEVAAKWRKQFEKDDAEPRKDEDDGA